MGYNKQEIIVRKGGPINFLKKCYLRYTCFTGVYMLNYGEVFVLHTAMIIGFIFTCLYGYSFYKQYYNL
jgi:hypothetical protein